MSPTLIAILTFVAAALFAGAVASAIYDVFFRYPANVRQRLQEMSGKTKGEKGVSLLNIKHLAESASEAPGHWRTWARDIVEQSALKIDAKLLMGLSLGLAISMAIVGSLLTRHWWPIVAGILAGLAVPPLYVLACRHLRIRRLTRQLPDALDVLCRAVRAGQTVPSAFQMVADDFSPPIADEFRYCYEQQNLGITYDAALRNLARRTGIMELRILVIALLVQSRSGGNLTDLLQNLATMVRKRLVLQQKVKALTGEGRMQAVVLIALPFVVFAAMYVLNREYAQILLDRPWILVGCAASQAIGAACIHKMIQIDY